MTPPDTAASDIADEGVEGEGVEDEFTNFEFVINPAVVKGASIAAVGLFILLVPDISLALLRPALGLTLIGIGLSDAWAWARRRSDRSWSRVLLSVLSLGVGGALLVYPAETLEAISTFLALYLLVRGLGAALRLLFRRSDVPIVDVIGASVQLSLGLLLLLVPSEIVQATLGSMAVAAMVIGGAILAVGLRSQSSETEVDASDLRVVFKSWLKSRDIGTERRAQLSEDLYFEQPGMVGKLTAWWVMLLLSVAIATYAILQDSTAVVIGAMLVAPLMTPIVGASAAIVNGRKARLAGSLALVAAGAAVAIILAYVIGTWTPTFIPLETNTQVTSRTSPNIIDMAIALAAGAAGAFAMINRRVASGLAGVAIAVALVPPLAVVGVTMGAGDFESASGAFLLFITNLIAILLSATLVFGLSGWTSVARIRSEAPSIALTVGVIVAAGMVVLLPLIFTSEGILTAATKQGTATSLLDEWLKETAPELTLDKVEVDGDVVLAEVSGPGSLADPEPITDQLSEEFGSPTTLTITLTPSTVVTYSQDSGEEIQEPRRIRPAESESATPPNGGTSGTPSSSASPSPAASSPESVPPSESPSPSPTPP